MGIKRIIVLGYIVRGPLGGLVFHHLQYVLGLKMLGYRVLFLEDSEDYAACYDPERHQLGRDPSYGLRFLHQVFSAYDLQHDWAYFDYHRDQWYGKSKKEVLDFCARSDMLLNLSGANPIRSWTAKVPVKIYIDTDPVFTQINNIEKPDLRARTALHTHHFTFGENVQQPDCLIPDDGFSWKPTRQVVVPEIWPQSPVEPQSPFTTVMQWDSYPERLFQGRRFGMKSSSFLPYFNLPNLVDHPFCLAIGSATAPIEKLQRLGWVLRDAPSVTRTPKHYQEFIAHSKAEWSVAKHGYVSARSGWFSERSCAYLASGRPVVVQDTGLDGHLPADTGILRFDTLEKAVDAIRRLRSDFYAHQKHCAGLIATYFHFEKVLSHLLARI